MQNTNLNPDWTVNITKIQVVPNAKAIPEFNYLLDEGHIGEGNTWIFLNDETNMLHTYSVDNDELVCGNWPANIPFDQFIDKLLEHIKES